MPQKHVTAQESSNVHQLLRASVGTNKVWRLTLKKDNGDTQVLKLRITDVIVMSKTLSIFVGTTLDGRIINLHTHKRWLSISWL